MNDMKGTEANSILDAIYLRTMQGIKRLANDPNAELHSNGHYYCKVCGEALTESVDPDGFPEDFPANAFALRECRCKRDSELIKKRQERRERLFANARKYEDAKLRSDDTSNAAKAIRDFVSRCSPAKSPIGTVGTAQPRTGICFWGNCGSGKTWYASALLNELIEKDLPYTVREQSIKLVQKIMAKETYRRENEVTIEKNGSAYMVNMKIADGSLEFMKLKLYAPTVEQAETIKERFITDPVRFYDTVIEAIFANEE